MTARELWRSVRPAAHRGGIRTAQTNRGQLCFVLCRCGWRSRLLPVEDLAWVEHDHHVDRHEVPR